MCFLVRLNSNLLGGETLNLGDVLVPAGSVGESSLVGALGQSVEDLSVLSGGLVSRAGKKTACWFSYHD